MSIFEVFILSFIQGVTELLPVSSSGHLILFSYLFEIEPTVEILVFLHIASFIAILFSYRKKILSIILSSDRFKIVLKILVAITPVATIGILFSDSIEELLYTPMIIAINLVIWGIIMIVVERYVEVKKNADEKNSLENISWRQIVVIALFQCFALIPGTSRSGATTVGGVLSGVKKEIALDFSFIIGLPAFLGAYLLTAYKTESLTPNISIGTSLLLLIITALVSYCVIELLKKYSNKDFLTIFGIYRILLGIAILVYLFN